MNHATAYEILLKNGATIEKSIIRLRRKLHQYPEVGNQEFQTTALLKKELKKSGLRITDGPTGTGLWADLETGRRGPTIAVRTDIDALEVSEQTGLAFASKTKGKMHACGHDVHMAVLVGAARLLKSNLKNLNGRIRFICQPAEEIPPGGARPMIKAGILKNPKVDAIIALHVDPEVPVGSIGLRDGVAMASVFDFDLKITGRSGHAALPHKTIDAITVAAEIISGLQQIVSRMVNPIAPAVITFGTIRGGQVRNIIAGEVILEGTARSLDRALSRKLPRLIKKTAVDIGRAFGAKVELIPIADYPGLSSNSAVNKSISTAYKNVYPKGKVCLIPPVMGAEDFACYLEKTPGVMFRLGVGNKKIGADKSWHHPAFMIDENAIRVGYTTMAAAVMTLLHQRSGPVK